jgi:hypothetical protein
MEFQNYSWKIDKITRKVPSNAKVDDTKGWDHGIDSVRYDLAGFTRKDGISTVAQYDKNKNAFINGNFRILKKYNPQIIMRDNKHFMSPEIEEKQESKDE